jgi:4-hydroxythreonine-4-phosphate dehydrogenase
MMRPTIAISIGCPSGIGPEVTVLAASRTDARCVVVGDAAVVRRACRIVGVAERRLVLVERDADVRRLATGAIGIYGASTAMRALPEHGRPTRAAGAAQLAWIDEATDLVRRGVARALVTAPVSKLAIATSGARGAARFRGHTEHLAERLGSEEVVMAFHSSELTTSLATTHLPLARVARAVTPEAVASATFWLADLLRRLGVVHPRVAVAALNPHAGEGGLLGHEEEERIAPGVELARRRLTRAGMHADLFGPMGAETAFRLATRGSYEGVVAMYHDQATIPSKLLGFGEAVNVTLGLPIVRTSVDHGTAYDLAGTGRADSRGMKEAIALAVRLASSRAAPRRPRAKTAIRRV